MITTLSTLCFPCHVLACVLFSHYMPLNISSLFAGVATFLAPFSSVLTPVPLQIGSKTGRIPALVTLEWLLS